MLICKDEINKTLEMIEGDYGLALPFELTTDDAEIISDQDNFSVKIFKEINGQPLIEKTYSNIQNQTIEFVLTKEESNLLPVGSYYYDLDWYQGQYFLGNLVAKAVFLVKEKAGALNES